METKTVEVRGGGTIPLPAALRRKYGVKDGDALTVVDAGGGVLLILAGTSAVERHAQGVAAALRRAGMRPDEVQAAIKEERQAYYQEQYAGIDQA